MTDFNEVIETINATLPVHSMWDGFWVHSFKRNTLVVSCSFDRIYYRDFDLIFKKVTFFNIPGEWRDTNIFGNDLIRLATPEEFHRHHPGFETGAHNIFAIDLYFENREKNATWEKETFFILAEHIYLIRCERGNNPVPEYIDPFVDEVFPCKKNRVIVR